MGGYWGGGDRARGTGQEGGRGGGERGTACGGAAVGSQRATRWGDRCAQGAHVCVKLDRPEAVELRRRPLCVAARDHAIIAGADLDAARQVGVARAGGAHAADLQAGHLVHLVAHRGHPDVAAARLHLVRLPVGTDLDTARDHGRLSGVRDEAEARVMRAERDRRAEVVRAITQHDGAAARGDRQVCRLLDGAEGCTPLAGGALQPGGGDEDGIGRERARLGCLCFHEWLGELAVAVGVVEVEGVEEGLKPPEARDELPAKVVGGLAHRAIEGGGHAVRVWRAQRPFGGGGGRAEEREREAAHRGSAPPATAPKFCDARVGVKVAGRTWMQRAVTPHRPFLG